MVLVPFSHVSQDSILLLLMAGKGQNIFVPQNSTETFYSFRHHIFGKEDDSQAVPTLAFVGIWELSISFSWPVSSLINCSALSHNLLQFQFCKSPKN